MRFKTTPGKKETVAVFIQNDDSLAIKAGAPVFLKIDGTDDGLDCVSAVSLAAAAQQSFFGIALSDIPAQGKGDCQVFGFMDYARVGTASRAASTDVWASHPAGALRDMLGFATGTGHTATQGDQCFTRVGAGSAMSVSGLWPAILGQTYASQTTQASSIGGSSTLSVSLMKVFVRSL